MQSLNRNYGRVNLFRFCVLNQVISEVIVNLSLWAHTIHTVQFPSMDVGSMERNLVLSLLDSTWTDRVGHLVLTNKHQ